MKLKMTLEKFAKIAIAVLLFVGIIATTLPPIEVLAAPAVSQRDVVDTPIYIGSGSVTRDYLRVYVMRDPNSGLPVYCTRKGASLPTSSFALQQATINANPLLFYRLNYIYTTYSAWSTGTLPYTTPNTFESESSVDYDGIEGWYGYIVNQLAIWMVLGEMGYTSGTLSGGTYNGYNLYDAFANGAIDTYTQSEYNTFYIPEFSSFPPEPYRTYSNSITVAKRNAYTILSAAYTRATAALSQTGSYYLNSIVSDASLTNQSAWTYDSVSARYFATIQANVTNGGTWIMSGAPTNCNASPASGVSGDWITISATYDQMAAGSSIQVRAVPPEPSGTRVLSLFTSNGQSFVSRDYAPQSEGAEAFAAWIPLPPPDLQLQKLDGISGLGLPGAVFSVYTDAAMTSLLFTGTTNASGYITLEDVADGVYYWREDAPPPGYAPNTTVRTFTVGGGVVIGGNTTISNLPAPPVPLTKRDAESNGPVEGATIGVYSDAGCTNLIASGTTDSSGVYTIPSVMDGTYYYRETAAPANYHLNPDIYSFTVTSGVISGTTTFYDVHYPDMTLQKYDADDPTLPVPGAQFGIYTDAACTSLYASATTDANGRIYLNDVPDGTYYWVEEVAPEGYYLDDTVYSFSIVYGAVSGTTTMYDNRLPEVQITKTGSDTGSGVSGATIAVYTDSGLSNLYYRGTTDSNGQITMLSVSDGTYYWVEEAAPAGYNRATSTYSFTVSSGTVTGDLSFINIRMPNVTLSKTDEGGNPIAGTEFTVYSDSAGTTEVASGDTNASGEFTVNNVADGVYYWRETQETPGYVPDPTMHTFTVLDGLISGTQSMTNRETMVILWKQDAVTEQLLSGTTFEIRNEGGEVVATGTTADDGSVEFERLPIGTYTFTETQATEGYLIDPTVFTFTIEEDGSITGETYVSNTRQQLQLQITKNKESGVYNEDTQTYDFPIVPAEGVQFSVFAAEEITDAVGNVIYNADDRVEVITTDASGVARTSTDLYYGRYYAIETAVTPDIILDDTRYDLTATQPDQTTPVVIQSFNDGEPIINRAIMGTLEIHKIAGDTGVPMMGVVFEVYDPNGDLVDVLTTNESGNAVTKVLPYGQYTLLETRTWSGYILSENQHFMIYEAPAEGEIISEAEITLANQRMATVEVYKVTSDGQLPMNNVIFGIFDTQTDAEIARITTDQSGYGYVEIIGGSYYMQELETWDGYAVISEPIPLDAQNATLYTFRETNEPTTTEIIKQGTDGTRLPNMYFTVKRANPGIPLEFVYSEADQAYICTECLAPEDIINATTTPRTMTNGQVRILGLKAGEYLVTEVQAPPGYIIDQTPVSLTVQRGDAATNAAVLTNAAITAKTGQSGATFQRLISYGMILTIISATLLLINEIRRLRRRNESETEIHE